ncbi:MAG: polysaccharide biosynthesis C-terminal domain-containing protein [Acidimicrobiia bacterium]
MGYGRLAPLALVVVGLGLNRDWLALGRAQGVRAGLPTVVQGAVIALGAAFVASDGGAAWVIGWGYALAAILSVLANRPEPGDSDHDEELRTDGWMLVAVLAAQVTSTFDILLLGVFIGASDAGIYAAVYRIPNAIMALLSMIFAGFLPLATDLRVRARGQYRKLIRRSLRVSGRCALALALCSPIAAIFVPFVYGDAYARGEIPLMILLAATAIATGAAPLHSFAQATARDRAYALILICAAVVNLGGNLALIPIGGMIAAASVTLATQVTLAVLLARFVWSDQRLGLHDLASR